MAAYFDTGVLVKLYCLEADSAKAAATTARVQLPLVYSPWHEIELRNALRLKQFRRELAAEEVQLSLQRIDEDLRSGVLLRMSPSMADVLRRAEDLSAAWTPSVGCRTLDIIHVAAAVVCGIRDFVTFDVRQRTLAGKAGLNVLGV